MSGNDSLFDRIGGENTISKVHETFYDKIYADPWLSKYFSQRPREHLVKQQNIYFVQLMGGPKRYCGQAPNNAHQFMMITEELFELRSKLLSEAIKENGVNDEHRKEWLALNDSFKKIIVKKSMDEVKAQYSHQVVLNFPKCQ